MGITPPIVCLIARTIGAILPPLANLYFMVLKPVRIKALKLADLRSKIDRQTHVGDSLAFLEYTHRIPRDPAFRHELIAQRLAR